MTPQRISITPSPPNAGQPSTVSYSGTVGPNGKNLLVSFDPEGEPGQITIPSGDSVTTLNIPPGTNSMTISDPQGLSASLSTTVSGGGGP